MKRVDVFFTDEDGHRVRPLIRFLELQELDVRQHTAPTNKRSAPYLVIVSEHYAEARWLVELAAAADAIAVLLVSAPLADGVRTTDLRAWPARSADKALASLAEWMKSPSAGMPPASTTNARKGRGSNDQSQNRGALVVLSLVVILLVWLATLVPEQEADAEVEAALEKVAQANDTLTPTVSDPNGLPGSTPSVAAPENHPSPPLTYSPSAQTTAGRTTYFANVRIVEHAITRRAICQRLWALDRAGPQCWATPDRFSWDPRYLPGALSPAA